MFLGPRLFVYPLIYRSVALINRLPVRLVSTLGPPVNFLEAVPHFHRSHYSVLAPACYAGPHLSGAIWAAFLAGRLVVSQLIGRNHIAVNIWG